MDAFLPNPQPRTWVTTSAEFCYRPRKTMSNCIHSLIAKSSPTPKNPIACIQETCSLSLEDRPLWSLTRTTARPLQTSRETLTSLSWFSCPLKKCPRPSEVSFLLDAVGVVCVRACMCVCRLRSCHGLINEEASGGGRRPGVRLFQSNDADKVYQASLLFSNASSHTLWAAFLSRFSAVFEPPLFLELWLWWWCRNENFSFQSRWD